MAAAIYKQGQGYWTRMMTAVAVGLLGLMGAIWLWDVLKAVRIEGVEPVYVSATGAVLFLGTLFVLTYWLVGRKHGVVDFMIATEGEMKKVNWSSRREIIGSTWVVICLTILIAMYTGVCDLAFGQLFQAVGVLETVEAPGAMPQ